MRMSALSSSAAHSRSASSDAKSSATHAAMSVASLSTRLRSRVNARWPHGHGSVHCEQRFGGSTISCLSFGWWSEQWPWMLKILRAVLAEVHAEEPVLALGQLVAALQPALGELELGDVLAGGTSVHFGQRSSGSSAALAAKTFFSRKISGQMFLHALM